VLTNVNVYDQAHQLARALAESEENQRYLAARDRVMADEKALEMVNDYRQKQLELHARQLGGEDLTDEDRESLGKLREVLELRPEVREYLDAEVRLVRMITDVQGILSEAISLDLTDEEAGEV